MNRPPQQCSAESRLSFALDNRHRYERPTTLTSRILKYSAALKKAACAEAAMIISGFVMPLVARM